MVFERLRSGRYQHVPQGEGEKRGGVDGFSDKVSRLNGRAKGALIAFAAVVFLFFGFSKKSPTALLPSTGEIVPGAQFLHVLLPVNKPDVHLCKTAISAGALDYPVPSIVTWNTTYDDAGAAEGGAHIARVAGILDYLNVISGTGKERANDVVLIVDGYDTWFQLRPDVLMERYFEINRQANNRVVKRLGQLAMDQNKISQNIIFGAQKKCTREADDPACYAVPESTLGKSAYGSKTDRGNDRERFLDSGFIMGELSSLKILMMKALDLLKADKQRGTAQDVFSRIFGEQEYQREVIRGQYQGSFFVRYHNFLQSFGLEKKDLLSPHPTHHKIQHDADTSCEYNIGLDYEGLLSTSTTSPTDLDWITHNDTKLISSLRSKNKISSSTRISLPADILRSLAPFWSRNPDPAFPSHLTPWSSIPLYTNLWTGSIPASIHHSSPRDDSAAASLRKTGWGKLWTQRHARKMLDAHVYEPYHSFATLKGASNETAWWPFHQAKWRLRNHTADKKKEWIAWEAVCGDGLADEIFRDGKGGWRPPRKEY